MELWPQQFESTVRSSLLSADPDLVLTPMTNLAALRLDSLSVMALLTSLEYVFKTTLPQDALAGGFDTTLGELWSYCGATNASLGAT